MLARREHSRAELRSKLAAKGFPTEIIDDALSGLDREGWLSDQRFTEMFIRARKERGYGPVRIRAELRERGIGDAMIAACVDMGDPEWVQRLERANSKRFGSSRARDFAERARQMRFLRARGFTAEQIHAVLDRK